MQWILDPYRIGVLVAVLGALVFLFWSRWRAPGQADRLIEATQKRQQMFLTYLDGVFAYLDSKTNTSEYQKRRDLMVAVEHESAIPARAVDAFRRSLAVFVGTLLRQGKTKLRWEDSVVASAIAQLDLDGYRLTKDFRLVR